MTIEITKEDSPSKDLQVKGYRVLPTSKKKKAGVGGTGKKREAKQAKGKDPETGHAGVCCAILPTSYTVKTLLIKSKNHAPQTG